MFGHSSKKSFAAITPSTGGGRSQLPRTVYASANKTGGAAGGRKSSDIGRGSLPGGRPSSTFRPTYASKETRPLNDRSYQLEMQLKLQTFLSDNNYPHQLKERDLKQPSRGDFIRIFEFIYRHVDREFHCPVHKLEEVVPRMFKDLGYPITIKASTIQTISATHSWPHVLGALCWLIDLIGYLETAPLSNVMYQGEGDFAEGEGNVCRKQIIFTYYIKCFKHAMKNNGAGNDGDFFAQFNDWFKEMLMNRYEGMDSVEELQRTVQKLEAEKNRLENAPRQDRKLEEQNEELAKDLRNLDEYCADLEEYERSVEQKAAEAKAKRQEKQKEIEELRATLKKKQQLVAAQKMSGEQARKLKFDRDEMERQMDQLGVDCDRLDKDKWAQERQVSHLTQQVESEYAQFAQQARALLAKVQPSGADWQSQVVEHSPRDPNFVDVCNKELEPQMQWLWQNANKSVHAANSDILSVQETIDLLNDELAAAKDEREEVENKIAQLDQDLESDKESRNAELRAVKDENKQLKLTLDEHKDLSSAACKEKEKQLDQAKKERDQLAESLEKKMKARISELTECVELIFEHFDYCQALKNQIKGEAEKIESEWKETKADLARRTADVERRVAALPK